MPIYISQAVYLSGTLDADDYINANNPRIGYHNLVQYGGVTADSEETNYPASNIANDSTAEYWESESNATQYVNFQMANSNWDYLAIAGHNLEGSVYQWQSRADPGDAWTDVTDERIPGDNSAIIDLVTTNLHPYVRLKLIPASGVFPKIAVVYIGRILTLQRRVYVGHTPVVYGRRTSVISGMSENGQYLGRVVKRRMLQTSISQQDVTPSYYRSYIDPFVQHAITRPFFVAWRPAQYPEEVGFCWSTSDIVMENQRSNGMIKFDIQMRALAPWTS